MHLPACAGVRMASCRGHLDARGRLWRSILPLVIFTVILLIFAPLVTSAPPTVRSVSGCVSQSQTSLACHTGTVIVLGGTNFLVNASSTVVNLGPYRCLNVTAPSTTSIRCVVPPFSPSDIERRLDVNVTVNGSTSAPLRNGVQSYGALTLVSAIGCANTSNIGTPSSPVYRSSGCGPDDRVVMTGSGFGSAVTNTNVRVVVQSATGDALCSSVTMSMNGTRLTCSLPATAAPGVWLPVRVTVGSDSVVQAGLLQFSALPVIVGVSGCMTVNTTRTGLCHTNQVITIRGANFQAPLSSVAVGSYACASPRVLSYTVITCTLPAIAQRDEGQWLNVTIRSANGTSTLPSAVQSYGLLSVVQVRGCAQQSSRNGTFVSTGCVPGSNLTIVGTGFVPQMAVFVEQLAYPCSPVVYINSTTVVCANAQLPSLADVLVPVVLVVTAFSPNFVVTSTNLLSFSVVPRATNVSGCLMVGAMATECHPKDTLTVLGANFTSQAVVFLLGARRRYWLSPAGAQGRTRLVVLLPDAIDAEDERRALIIGVQVGNSNTTLPRAVWMVNALTVKAAWGCLNQTSFRGTNTSSLCVAGAPIKLIGQGFTPSSILHVVINNLWVQSDVCVQEQPQVLLCRLPRLSDNIPAGALSVSLLSGTSSVFLVDYTVAYIPTPVIRQLSSNSGCTSTRGQPLKDCFTGAIVSISGQNFQPFTTVELFASSRATTPPVQCASLRYNGPNSFACTLPRFEIVTPTLWVSLRLNSSLPEVEGPSTFMSEALLFAGDAPPAVPGDTRWGLTIDELVIVIVAVTFVILLLLGLQLLWCLVRLAGVRFPRLERLCPKLMAAMRGPSVQGEDRGDINLGLLQHNQLLRFDPSQPQPSEGNRAPYVPFAAAAYTAQPLSPEDASGYRPYNAPPSMYSLYNSHLVPPSLDGAQQQPQQYQHYAPPL